MKSIKEKAEEYSRCIASSEYTREDFASGANYVLEQVEILLNSQRFVDNPSQELHELIEQLKK